MIRDLSAAFDTVEHNILLQRMSNIFGIKGKALDWFKSYQTEFVNDVHNVMCGVPQGSVLGPISYLQYTYRLGDILQCHNMPFHFYADDSQLFITFTYNDDSDQDRAVQCIEA